MQTNVAPNASAQRWMSRHWGEDVQYRTIRYANAAHVRAMMIGIQNGKEDLEPKIRAMSQYQGRPITRAAGATIHGDGGVREVIGMRRVLLALYAASARSAIASNPARMVVVGGV